VKEQLDVAVRARPATTIATGSNALLAALMVILAGPIASSLGSHQATPVVQVMALTLVVAGLSIAVFCAASIRRLEPAALEAVDPGRTAMDRLEQIIRSEHARTYIAFSEWIGLGFPVVNQTGVTWASRFDSMWALKGEVWRARFDPAAAKELTDWWRERLGRLVRAGVSGFLCDHPDRVPPPILRDLIARLGRGAPQCRGARGQQPQQSTSAADS